MKRAGLEPDGTLRELRHSFVSLLSDHGIPLKRIAQLVGHTSQATRERSTGSNFTRSSRRTRKPWTSSSPSETARLVIADPHLLALKRARGHLRIS
ncbi:hypothetical protein [Nocardiopsis sp. NPDC055824]